MATVSIFEKGESLATYIKKSPLFSHCTLLNKDTKTSGDVALIDDCNLPAFPSAGGIILLCADDRGQNKVQNHAPLITYGINPLATLTSSSIEIEKDDLRFICCLQRSIITLSGTVIEPQEFPVFLPGISEISRGLALTALGLVTGLGPARFQKDKVDEKSV